MKLDKLTSITYQDVNNIIQLDKIKKDYYTLCLDQIIRNKEYNQLFTKILLQKNINLPYLYLNVLDNSDVFPTDDSIIELYNEVDNILPLKYKRELLQSLIMYENKITQ